MCPLDFLWRHYWKFPWQFETAWSFGFCGTELKPHYYLVNWTTVRNYWKMIAPFCDNFWDFNMHLLGVGEKILVFWKDVWYQNVYFCFKFSFWPFPVSPAVIRKSALESRNLSMASITKIYVSEQMLSLKFFFLTVQRKKLCLSKNITAAFSQVY